MKTVSWTFESKNLLTIQFVLLQIYQQLQQQVISSQPADRQAQLSISLQGLMSDVQRNLEPKNRDKFTQVCSFLLGIDAYVTPFQCTMLYYLERVISTLWHRTNNLMVNRRILLQ